ncbi:MAG: hypothetical protein C1943_14155 [Halochromatium sp.]|nr:hypothetical protein [Halochromatium sp.]
MTEHLQLIDKKLEHLERMHGYLMYSLEQVSGLMPINDWKTLTPKHHETLAAFRVRFSEFQEHSPNSPKQRRHSWTGINA